MAKAHDTVQAGPTKRFFVEMLTRDISLEDAILDLLDNCIDGVLRQIRGKRKRPRPYDGFWAEIHVSPDSFEITDNCGGIPREIARTSAFMLGRPELERDADIETVGMYGIGMKRAIFKMGRECVVTSQPSRNAYEVTISPGWFGRDRDWTLPMTPAAEGLKENGTRIRVSRLLDPIKGKFDQSASTFVDNLGTDISQLYALIIGKGFTVRLNGEEVQPVDLTLLAPRTVSAERKKSIAPYAFKGTVEGVRVELTVGFRRKLATERELDSETERKRTRSEAGWAVICNDRVVLYADTSKVTGWGTANVPAFHNQFISIAGIVSFRSKNSLALPLNTTKRGLDTSSSVYLYVLDMMREGLKLFTGFTNKWKSREKETDAEFEQMEKRKPGDILSAIPRERWSTVRKGGKDVAAKKFTPALPVPQQKDPMCRIVFSRPQSDIRTVAEYVFDDPDRPPSEVGEECFDGYLEEAQE